jgi:hypothetical protein
MTGGQSLSPLKEADKKDPFEHQQKLPPPPLQVSKARFPILKLASRSQISVVFQFIKPSWRSYVQYVDLAARRGNQAMAHFRDVYESLTPREQACLWPEQLCDLAQIEPGELVGAVCRTAWEHSTAESSMITSFILPATLLATAKLAKLPENFRDREMILRYAGLLPDKKGTSINIVNNPMAAQEVKLPDLAGHARLRSFDEEVIEMSRDLEQPFLVKEESDA